MVTVGNFPDLASAETAASLLRAEGIEVNIAEEHHAGLNWQLGTALRGIRVQVSDEDLAAASELLRTPVSPDDETASAPAEACPACGADAVVPAPWKRRAKGLALLFPPAILIYPLLVRSFSRFACRACGHAWR